ncbi:hypothetical protein NDU88_008764 [Pleurodeles waltl]|uniref:Uncharacterized protein n=1 Tax=Pleurodeles waltl TaxID=8319 RepID=A0AAV7PQE9_PLEWA|nr:hypothetical protein NDU88_008764 [Pleurodeles waltl]
MRRADGTAGPQPAYGCRSFETLLSTGTVPYRTPRLPDPLLLPPSASAEPQAGALRIPTYKGNHAMPGGKTVSKTLGRPARQLLFPEALRQQKHPPAKDPPHPPHTSMVDDMQGATMDCILQEISAVSRKLEGMEGAMVSLTAETRSMHLDIAGFQSQVTGLDQRVTTVETQIAFWTDRDQELLHLRSKLIDLEDRSCRNNVRLLGFPEGIEGADMYS